MNLKKLIPNILTALRVMLTLLYGPLLYYLNLYNESVFYFISILIVFILICLTDLLDGKIARKMKVESRFGALFDLVSDLVFIVSSHAVLIIQNIIPIWFLIIILAKFMEFLITSSIIKKHNKINNSVFIFDYFGRIAAANFYLLPGLILFLYRGLNMVFINLFIYITVILGIVSSLARCIECYKGLKTNLSQSSGHGIDIN